VWKYLKIPSLAKRERCHTTLKKTIAATREVGFGKTLKWQAIIMQGGPIKIFWAKLV